MRSFSRIMRRVGRESADLRLWKRPAEPAAAVTFEIGRGTASIVATVRADGRARLAFGSGEEFVGPYDEMPLAVVRGARDLLQSAGSFGSSLSRVPQRRDYAPVRIVVQAHGESHELRATIGELRDADSSLAPLWTAFTLWMHPLLAVLFDDPPPRTTGREIAALSRARALTSRAEV